MSAGRDLGYYVDTVYGRCLLALVSAGFARIGSVVFLCAAVAWGACWRLG